MDYLGKFKNYLQKNNMADCTIDNYIKYVEKYTKWVEKLQGKPFLKLEKQCIEVYKETFEQVKYNGSKSSSLLVNLSGLKKFNEFLIEEGIQQELVIEKRKQISRSNFKEERNKELKNREIKTRITEKDVEEFRSKVCAEDSIRNYAIITVLAYGGLKLSECIHLKLNDLDFQRRVIHIRTGNHREVPMDGKVEASLKLYLRERAYEDYITKFLFVSKQDKMMDRTMIQKILYKHRGTTSITTQTLRIFYCERLKVQGYSMEDIAKLGGYEIKKCYLKRINL